MVRLSSGLVGALAMLMVLVGCSSAQPPTPSPASIASPSASASEPLWRVDPQEIQAVLAQAGPNDVSAVNIGWASLSVERPGEPRHVWRWGANQWTDEGEPVGQAPTWSLRQLDPTVLVTVAESWPGCRAPSFYIHHSGFAPVIKAECLDGQEGGGAAYFTMAGQRFADLDLTQPAGLDSALAEVSQNATGKVSVITLRFESSQVNELALSYTTSDGAFMARREAINDGQGPPLRVESWYDQREPYFELGAVNGSTLLAALQSSRSLEKDGCPAGSFNVMQVATGLIGRVQCDGGGTHEVTLPPAR